MRILIDEMYPPSLRAALDMHGISAASTGDLDLRGAPDQTIFALAVAESYSVLTENVADFVQIAAEHSAAGSHHSGLLIALSSRFSRRSSAMPVLARAVAAISDCVITDRIIYLQQI